jgi:hypothetical protein
LAGFGAACAGALTSAVETLCLFGAATCTAGDGSTDGMDAAVPLVATAACGAEATPAGCVPPVESATELPTATVEVAIVKTNTVRTIRSNIRAQTYCSCRTPKRRVQLATNRYR